MVRDAVARGETGASWLATGADVVVDTGTETQPGFVPRPVTPTARAAITAVPGVRRSALGLENFLGHAQRPATGGAGRRSVPVRGSRGQHPVPALPGRRDRPHGHGARTGHGIEALPAVLAAGLVCALALPALAGHALNLSVFTGTGTPVPLGPDWLALGLPVVAVVAIAGAALAAETAALRRRGVTGLLRAH